MSMIKKFFGWLFLTRAYMATLSDEEIGRRALGREGWRKYSLRKMEYACASSIRNTDALLLRLRAARSARGASSLGALFGILALAAGLMILAIVLSTLFKVSIGTAIGCMVANAVAYLFIGLAGAAFKS